MSIIRIQNAHKFYNRGRSNELHVMDNINLELPESGMVAVFGKSGCGKTTLLNAIGGLDKLASGSIELFGQNIREDTDTLRNRYIGYIFQNYNLNVRDTVYENVAAALRLCGMTDEAEIAGRVRVALANVGMEKYVARTPDTLSGGQQQRVAIARALVKNPAIILADEPTGNLDEANTVMVMDILKEISRTQLVLLVTHEANLVDFYCDRVIEIVDGRIVGDRANTEANGYVQRNKNDIYLGELACTETRMPGAIVEYYGVPAEPLRLRIVHVGGKLYLKAEDPSVKFLDDSGEIRLLDGVFQEKPAEVRTGKETANGNHLDMSALPPVEVKHPGRLYHLKGAVAAAWRENFARKHKRGKRLLRVCLFMLSVVMVFMTAAIGAGLQSYMDMRETHNEALFYVPLDNKTDYSALMESVGQNGIDFTRLMGGYIGQDADSLSFDSAAFITASPVSLTANAMFQPLSKMSDLPLRAGVKTTQGDYEVVITTPIADTLIESSTVGYIDEYADLVGMVSTFPYFGARNGRLRIVGVVESDERFCYMPDLTLTQYVIQNAGLWLPVVPASLVDMGQELKSGEALYLENGVSGATFAVGDRIQLMGMPLTVTGVLRNYADISSYPHFVKETYGETLITDPYMYNGSMYEWLFEHYSRYIREFYQSMIKARPTYAEVTLNEWLIAEKGSMAAYVEEMGMSSSESLSAYLYRKDFGRYPTDEELLNYMWESTVVDRVNNMTDRTDSLFREYQQYIDARYSGNMQEYALVLCDADYMALSGYAGKTTESLGFADYYTYSVGDGDSVYYNYHLLVHSTDPVATEARLVSIFGDDGVITPREVYESNLENVRAVATVGAVGILVVLGLMCLCVFFIMRSSFMSRVREVGILRAIGVTRRNLTFRFAVETALLITLTLVVGYLLAAAFIASLANAALFSTLFYFPAWLAVGLLVVICAAALLFGVLPALLLLRKTPSEILSKYDI